MSGLSWSEYNDFLGERLGIVEFECYHCHRTTRFVEKSAETAEAQYWEDCARKAKRLLDDAVRDMRNTRASLAEACRQLKECADEYENAAQYKGEHLMAKHCDANYAEAYRQEAKRLHPGDCA